MMPGRRRDEGPRFEGARRWRAWHEWPGIMGLATGIALWVFFAVGVVAPVGEALAQLRSRSQAAPAQVVCTTTDGGAIAAAQPCACACPQPSPPESLPRSG